MNLMVLKYIAVTAIYAAATIIYMETIVIYYGSITDTVITETSGGNRMAQQKLGQTRSDNVIKKEMIAMLLAGGQGSRLGVLTANVAKPAVSFGGKYRIIDFPLSNCINSGIDTVGVLTQYQPLRLNSHIGIGIPWDLDRNNGGVAILPPYEKSGNSEWYTGTANAIYQNMRYIDSYNPDYVLILSGDHIYKMDYEVMLDFHKIPVRQLECCSGDLADLKVKSCDIEAWSPRQQKYFEVCSCSNLGDAQARRLKIRVKGEDGKMYLPHTLNNTVVAPPRMLIAFLENNLQADGSVLIPKVLQPYMGGKTVLIPKK